VSAAASAADKISDAAADIAAIVTQNIGVHPIVSQVFEKVEERLMQAKVGADSSLVGKRIGELDLAARMGVDIIALRRDKDWVINPQKTERVRSGDVLVVRGVYSGIKEFKELAEQKLRRS
jgi:uncharacterized protein with PhoU and TrkA domain